MRATVDRTSEIMDFIQGYVQAHGFAPSQREIAEAVGLASASDIKRQLGQLEDAGKIKRQPGKARAIRVNGKGC